MGVRTQDLPHRYESSRDGRRRRTDHRPEARRRLPRRTAPCRRPGDVVALRSAGRRGRDRRRTGVRATARREHARALFRRRFPAGLPATPRRLRTLLRCSEQSRRRPPARPGARQLGAGSAVGRLVGRWNRGAVAAEILQLALEFRPSIRRTRQYRRLALKRLLHTVLDTARPLHPVREAGRGGRAEPLAR